MVYLVLVFLLIAVAGCAHLSWLLWRANTRIHRMDGEWSGQLEAAQKKQLAYAAHASELSKTVNRLSKWTAVADADEAAAEIRNNAAAILSQAETQARAMAANAERRHAEIIDRARHDAQALGRQAEDNTREANKQAQSLLAAANDRSSQIIADAHVRAERIAGDALEVVRNTEHFERTARAMKNIIEGYGDEYLVPASSLLDDLAEDFGHKEAGQQLKAARERTRLLIKNGEASRCEYVEASRREGAERFVLDAFNGKVDSTLSRVRHDNYGKLAQEIRDDMQVVNHGGRAFREARITEVYLEARLEELRWATIALELKRQEQEEQRRIREQLRDEERAQREYERAIRETAKEEEVLKKAMARARAEADAATAEQRAEYELKLAALQAELEEAQINNQRAISMAQQTKRGHVYIISNVGSFGENIYKIGLTRRLDPVDRIWELGDASVPFDFDIHAIIMSEDAPALETRLHKHFLLNQINKVNHRKEFFRATVADLRNEIEAMGIEAKWTMAAEAREYRDTLAIEKAIREDPLAREAWINRQLVLDPVESGQLVEIGRDDE